MSAQRAYLARMVVAYRGQRYEVDAVEFWLVDQKLTLRQLNGAERTEISIEAWASAVTFTEEVAA